jgi:site-specific DNA-methyltransferase (adenine-specific)
MGAGTTAQVCLEENRNFIGFEIDETYHQMCAERVLPWTDNVFTRLQ